MSKLKKKVDTEVELSREFEMTKQLDTVFDCLRSARRRYLLYYLFDSEDAVVTVEEIVEAIRQYEASGIESDNALLRQSIRLSLVHVHLPRLEAVGAIDYDPRRGNVRFDGYASLEEWLERACQLELD